MPLGLHVHVAEDLDRLADIAAEILVVREGGVLDRDCIVVPSAPVRQWLDWRLAERLGTSGPGRSDGIVANVVNYFPEEFVQFVEREASAVTGSAGPSWSVDRLTVRILATQSPRPSVSRARSIAADIDDLVRWRPDVVRGDTAPTRGAEDALRVYRDLAAPDDLPLARKDRTSAALRRERVPTLPSRILVFGLSSLPGGPTFAELMMDLSTHCEVHVLLACVDADRVSDALRGDEELTDTRPLSSWARESDEAIASWRRVAPRRTQWVVYPSSPRSHSALGALACALRGHASADAVESPLEDDSIIVVGASGIDRQVEQLRDVVLSIMDRDGVDASGVLVATTDPGAVMDSVERHWLLPVDERRLPRLPVDPTIVSASDARHRLDASVALLALLRSRCTRSDVLEFAQYPAVAATLGLDRAGRDRITHLTQDANLTFGVSPHQRDAFDVYHERGGLRADAGTWQRLIDRVVATSIIGASGSDSALGVPDDLDLVARIEPLVSAIDDASSVRTGESPLREWLSRLESWMADLAGDPRVFDDTLGAALDRARHTLPVDDPGPTLSLADFAELWTLLARRSSHQRVFGRSGVTVTDVASLAYAPHRVVCLVGLDDHRLPTGSWPSAVMGERRPGDPDPRYAALAALRAASATARSTLIVTFTDRRLDDGRALDPPIALDEFLDVVSSVTRVPRVDLVRTSPRHAFSVPTGVDHMIDTTLDPRAAQLVSPRLGPTTPAGDESATLDVANLRSFAAGPDSFYVRRSLRADIPRDDLEDPVSPPLTLTDRHRSDLQRHYVWAVADEVRRRYPFGTLPAMPTEPHGANDPCDDACAWFHDISHPLQSTLTSSERHNANVPPRLWRHRMVFGQLDLAAYNLVRDLGPATPWDVARRSRLFGDVELSDGTVVRCASLRAAVDQPAIIDTGGALVTVSWEPREGRAGDWRHVLRAALDLVVLRALAPDREVYARSYFLPNRTTRYERSNAKSRVVAGQLPGNPRATLRFDGDVVGARATLLAFVDLFRRGCRAPLPLFSQTSVAAVASALGRDAADAWTNFTGYGESQQLVHQLLYPLSARDLLTLDDGRLPLVDELTAILSQFSIEDLSQAHRGHDGTGDGASSEPDLFTPLVGSP